MGDHRSTAAADVVCYYHEPEKVPLLYHAVLPAVARLSGPQLRLHVERHWLHGPHLRIRVTGPEPTVRVAADDLAATLRAYLATHPSRGDVDDAELLRRCVAAGRAELVPGPYEPIMADNTVLVGPPADGHVRELLGSDAAVACRAELLRAGLDPVATTAADLVAHGNTSARRVRLALTAMAVHAAAYPAGYGAGYNSFLSHLEDFLHLRDTDGRIRAGFHATWQRQSDRIVEEVGRLVAPDRPGHTPVAEAWRSWEQVAWRITRAAHDRGDIPVVPGDQYARRARALGDPATERQWDVTVRTEFSPYHRGLNRMDFLSKAAVRDDFGPYRFGTNVLYLLLAICDITPSERYLAAYLFSEAVQRLTGVTWQDAMRGHLRASEATP
ncbi:hypothetical protein AB0883_28600 [Micromonospora sp. NPDC047812]|uniref:hypothetical protein n=1 Tax=Micromonospora sp. NPDC047812 TaxID=3155742 RepID=UPI0034517B47